MWEIKIINFWNTQLKPSDTNNHATFKNHLLSPLGCSIWTSVGSPLLWLDDFIYMTSFIGMIPAFFFLSFCLYSPRPSEPSSVSSYFFSAFPSLTRSLSLSFFLSITFLSVYTSFFLSSLDGLSSPRWPEMPFRPPAFEFNYKWHCFHAALPPHLTLTFPQTHIHTAHRSMLHPRLLRAITPRIRGVGGGDQQGTDWRLKSWYQKSN